MRCRLWDFYQQESVYRRAVFKNACLSKNALCNYKMCLWLIKLLTRMPRCRRKAAVVYILPIYFDVQAAIAILLLICDVKYYSCMDNELQRSSWINQNSFAYYHGCTSANPLAINWPLRLRGFAPVTCIMPLNHELQLNAITDNNSKRKSPCQS